MMVARWSRRPAAPPGTQPLEGGSDSSNIKSLDPRIRRWIADAGWAGLREVQERAIPPILDATNDVILAASTAAGKTEAAFFGIFTRLTFQTQPAGVVLCVSPLKALINDQHRRLVDIADRLEIPITPWHGDSDRDLKTRFLKNPSGCLLITPESIEALLMRRGESFSFLFAGLQYCVIDELHSVMATERGKQLQSQLHRIELAVGRRVCRIGLSATLGDMRAAAEFLRPGHADEAVIIESHQDQQLQVIVKGVEETAHNGAHGRAPRHAIQGIAEHMYDALRGSNNLVFPNSRASVEFFADTLRRFCEEDGIPNEFWPHHGNLSRDIREEAEAALKCTNRPATAICTSTLELGIDIGPVRSIVQIGPPPSVASLRQRLGRCGRRKGEPMILRSYCIEDQVGPRSELGDQLREGFITSLAMVRLLNDGWYEPVGAKKLHASTLVQQVLSILAQKGEVTIQCLWESLCGADAPFLMFTKGQFVSVLRNLAQRDLIVQIESSLFRLAPKGQNITGHFTFYAAFASDEEYRLVTSGRFLGSMPMSRPLTEGALVIFAGKRWQVVKISQAEKLVELQPASGGELPKFSGQVGITIHDRVRQEMRHILATEDPVYYLDAGGQRFLREARDNYYRLDLNRNWLVRSGYDVHILTWAGDCINDTLCLMLMDKGLPAMNQGLSVAVRNVSTDMVTDAVDEICRETTDSTRLAAPIQNKIQEKWDEVLPEDVLTASFASAHLDTDLTRAALEEIRLHERPVSTIVGKMKKMMLGAGK